MNDAPNVSDLRASRENLILALLEHHPLDSISMARFAMYVGRIRAGFCPICEPNAELDPITDCCTNPYCVFAAFASPLSRFSPGGIDDLRR